MLTVKDVYIHALLEQVEGIVVADLDGGEVTVCRTLDLPDMPQGPKEMFKVAYRLAQSSSDIVQLER